MRIKNHSKSQVSLNLRHEGRIVIGPEEMSDKLPDRLASAVHPYLKLFNLEIIPDAKAEETPIAPAPKPAQAPEPVASTQADLSEGGDQDEPKVAQEPESTTEDSAEGEASEEKAEPPQDPAPRRTGRRGARG